MYTCQRGSGRFCTQKKSTAFDLHLKILRRLYRKMILTVVLSVVLSSSLPRVLALPALPLTTNPSLVHSNTSSISVSSNASPPQEPTCPSTQQWGITMGHPKYDDCDYILTNLYPKDPLARPVMRNFYVAAGDVSHTMSNFRLPYDQSHGETISPTVKHYGSDHSFAHLREGTCSIQVLLATDFNSVPYDQATWNDIRGAARTIFRSCIRGKNLGGVVPRNGMRFTTMIGGNQ